MVTLAGPTAPWPGDLSGRSVLAVAFVLRGVGRRGGAARPEIGALLQDILDFGQLSMHVVDLFSEFLLLILDTVELDSTVLWPSPRLPRCCAAR